MDRHFAPRVVVQQRWWTRTARVASPEGRFGVIDALKRAASPQRFSRAAELPAVYEAPAAVRAWQLPNPSSPHDGQRARYAGGRDDVAAPSYVLRAVPLEGLMMTLVGLLGALRSPHLRGFWLRAVLPGPLGERRAVGRHRAHDTAPGRARESSRGHPCGVPIRRGGGSRNLLPNADRSLTTRRNAMTCGSRATEPRSESRALQSNKEWPARQAPAGTLEILRKNGGAARI